MDSDEPLDTGNEGNQDNSQFGSDDKDNYEEGWDQKDQADNVETKNDDVEMKDDDVATEEEAEGETTNELIDADEDEEGELHVDSKTEGIEQQIYDDEEGDEEEINEEEYVPVDTSPSKEGAMVFEEGESDNLNSGFDATQILSSFEYGVERLIVFQQINQERIDMGLPEIELNIDYMSLVDVHCKEMTQNKYISQYDTQGFKPYQRFGLEGCVDWINDITIGLEYHEKISPENIEDVLLECHKQIYDSDSKNQILDPYATHVSIGLSIDNKLVKYTEVYYHKYMAVNNYIPNDWYKEMPFHIQGTLFMENKGICGVHVSHDPPPQPIEPNVLSTLPNYVDRGKSDIGVIWPWELSFDPHNNSFVIPVDISTLEQGYYYYKIYCDDISSIPLSQEDGADYKFPTSSSLLVGAILLPHIEDLAINKMEEELGDPTSSVEPLEIPKPITEICLIDGKSDLSRKYTEKLYGYPSDEGVAIQIGYLSKAGSNSFISSVGFRSSKERTGSDINISVIPYNIMTTEEFPSQPELYMYYEIDSQATSYITEIGMIYGDAHPPPNAKVYQLPLKYQTFVYTISVDSNIVDSSAHTPVSSMPSYATQDQLVANASRHTHDTPSEPTESFAGVEFDSTSIKQLEEELREAMQLNATLSKANDSHQKRIIQILKEIPEVYANLPHAEAEKKYNETLQVVSDCRSQYNIMIKNFESELVYQKGQYDNTLNRSEIVSSNFMLLVKDIAQRSINSRTGKPIPDKIIQQLLEADSKKNELLMDIRLKQLEILNKMKKIDRSLREREQLAEGLHLIDFEQLKIENQALNEKIEERNEELHKLKKKNTTTVHILTHTREKLQFVEQNNQILRDKLTELTNSLSDLRDELTEIKQIRDKLRHRTEVLKVDQGFLQTKKLITDYDKRRVEIDNLNGKIGELQKKHTFLLTQFKKKSTHSSL